MRQIEAAGTVAPAPHPSPTVTPASQRLAAPNPLGNRKARRVIRKRGAMLGNVEYKSVRVERADGRCVGRKLVRA